MAELLELAITRTEAINPALNAVMSKHYELTRQAIEQGLPEGTFRGVPFPLRNVDITMAGQRRWFFRRFGGGRSGPVGSLAKAAKPCQVHLLTFAGSFTA